jgi:UPF0755 protein
MRRALAWAGGLIALAVLATGLAALWFWFAVYGDRSHPASAVQVVVKRGATFAAVTRELAHAGVIDDAPAFRLLGRLRHDEDDVRAGAYRFAAHRTQDDVLHALVTGGAQVAAWVTIPEGFTARQIARRLQAQGIGPARAFVRSFERSSLDVDGTWTRGLEGFLFPSTYLVPLGASPADVQRQMTAEFFKELPGDAATRARALGVTVPEVVTVASLVEREAKTEPDRPMIAAVIYNRLRLGMPLQIDASIEYALPKHESELSLRDVRIESPYNTYLNAGLPPTPIANPGLPSLEAALHPSKTDALYYVYCGHGRHVFARTLAQHQANVARCLR